MKGEDGRRWKDKMEGDGRRRWKEKLLKKDAQDKLRQELEAEGELMYISMTYRVPSSLEPLAL